MSILNTRRKRCTQLIAAQRSTSAFASSLDCAPTRLPRLPGVTSPRPRAVGREHAMVAAAQTPAKPATADKKRPWAINLMSSRNKRNIEQSAARARSMDIAVEIHSAEVKGRTYWRLQVTGFPTVRAAKAVAVPVKEKPGIDDVWIGRENTVPGRI
ncbi:MAG: SPOR domain-containing protein [Gammaproteobacteria bacterium]